MIQQLFSSYQELKNGIANRQKNIQKLSLKKVSPKMLESKDMKIIIPGRKHIFYSVAMNFLGAYKSNAVPVTIKSICSEISVIISSKQKPKTLELLGSDGKVYKFLLKGKEDLRLDERVMQLFDLMNNLINMNSNLR